MIDVLDGDHWLDDILAATDDAVAEALYEGDLRGWRPLLRAVTTGGAGAAAPRALVEKHAVGKGDAHHWCRVAWLAADQLGVDFVTPVGAGLAVVSVLMGSPRAEWPAGVRCHR